MATRFLWRSAIKNFDPWSPTFHGQAGAGAAPHGWRTILPFIAHRATGPTVSLDVKINVANTNQLNSKYQII